MRLTMHSILTGAVAAAAVAGTLTLTAAPASAMSATVLPLATGAQPEVVLVSGGCGPFAHRGFYGVCRPNFYGGYGYGYGYRRWGGWHGGWHRGWHHGWHRW